MQTTNIEKLAACLLDRFAIVPLINTAGQVCRVPVLAIMCFELMGPLKECPQLTAACDRRENRSRRGEHWLAGVEPPPGGLVNRVRKRHRR